MTGTSKRALEVYASSGAELAARYDAVDADPVFAALADLLPAPCAMLDVGAGTGRDAAWFAARGFVVTAVEPTDALRRIGEARADPAVTWLADTLPQLAVLAKRQFGLILLNAVWHHLDPQERDIAMTRLAGLALPGGRVLIALRQGADLPGQPVERMEAEVEIDRARRAGFSMVGRHDAVAPPGAGGPADIGWVWLALARREGERG